LRRKFVFNKREKDIIICKKGRSSPLDPFKVLNFLFFFQIRKVKSTKKNKKMTITAFNKRAKGGGWAVKTKQQNNSLPDPRRNI
jgi:hypothetical protein